MAPEPPDKSALEQQKLQLEIKELQSRLNPFWKVFEVLTSIAIPLVVSVMAVVISWRTQGEQAHIQQEQLKLQETQADLEKKNSELENSIRHRELLNAVVQLATDEQSNRRLAGILTLAEFWKEETTVGYSLAAALIASGPSNASVRCQAADAIGRAYVDAEGYRNEHPARRVSRIAHFLYGTGKGGMGVVVRQNLHLKDSGYERSAHAQCINEFDATKQAIRTNWEYLVDVNLKDTELKQIQLYRADLHSTTLARADVEGADFACANLENTSFEGANWNKLGRVELANVRNAKPEEFRQWALAHGALDMGDIAWLDWRKGGFRVSNAGKPVQSTTPETSTDKFCGAPVEAWR